MRKIICLLTVAVTVFLFTACNLTKEQPTAAPTATAAAEAVDNTVAEIVLSANKYKVALGTGDTVALTAECYNAGGTLLPDSNVAFYAEDNILESCYFSPVSLGVTNVYATCGSLISNSIQIETVAKMPTYVDCDISSHAIETGGRITFGITSYNGKDKYYGSGRTVTINGNTQKATRCTMDTPGVYTAYATQGGVDSPAVMFAVKDSFSYNLTLTANKTTVEPGETVHFTAKGKMLADGSVINGDIRITQCGQGDINDSYTFTKQGYYSFCAVYDGEVSHTVIIQVTDAVRDDAPFNGFTSSIPAIVINTYGQSIQQSELACSVSVYGTVSKGATAGSVPNLVSQCEIKTRGQSSLGFVKKQYSLHTVNSDGTNNNINLLGLPKENDWVLNGSYADKSLIRNSLAQNILAKVMPYTCRTRYCEVYLRNADGTLNYLGVYTLIEKIKIDSKRLNINKLTPDDTARADITGGYIVAYDKVKNGDNAFDTDVGTFTVVQPKGSITKKQDDYIKNYIKRAVKALTGSDKNDPKRGAAAYIDLASFAVPLAITEFLRNADGFCYSTYMYKDKDGLLKYGPGWDYDLSMGNASYNSCLNAKGWYVIRNSKFVRSLMSVDEMKKLFITAWKDLRKDILTDANIDAYIDAELAKIGYDAIARSCARWPEHWNGTYIWPNPASGKYATFTYYQEIERLRSFLHERAAWMDERIDDVMKLKM